MYLLLFLGMRAVFHRTAGNVSLSDLLLVVLLADAAQNAMAGEYKTVTDGLILVGTLMFWSFFLDFLGHKNKAFERLVHPPPLKLIDNGKLLRRNMRKELITIEELMSQLRENGCESPAEVKSAFMEGDGQISVIKKADQ